MNALSIVTKDQRGTVIEGTVVKHGTNKLSIGTEEELAREGRGADGPYDLNDVLYAQNGGSLEGKRVQIVVSEIK